MALLAFAVLAISVRPAALAAQTLHLPYPGGLAIAIIEGYNGGTHNGVERYSLDLVRADGATSGSPVLAPASGSVAFAEAPGDQHGCIGVTMDDSGDLHYMLCHIILNQSYTYGDRIQQGQLLGTVGAPGLVGNNGTAHVHMQLYTLPGGVRTPLPFAPPAGIPLDGVSMLADGSPNQWACSGDACGLVSRNSGASALGGATAPGSSLAPPSLPPLPSAAGAPTALAAGQTVLVQGTGDCLRAHAQPDMTSAQTGCTPDGSAVTIVGGPVAAGGETWWQLFNLGWSVADYLRPPVGPAGAGASAAVPSPPTGSSSAASSGAPAQPPTTTATAPPSALGVGALAEVAGSGGCVRIHVAPTLSAEQVACLQDGALSAVLDGPRSADGHTWWLLDDGWAVGDYLQAVPY